MGIGFKELMILLVLFVFVVLMIVRSASKPLGSLHVLLPSGWPSWKA